MNQDRLSVWQKAVEERRAVKVIAGIANFDTEYVLSIARAAEAGRAHAVDIAARSELIRAVREMLPQLPIFASSVVPQELLAAVEAGADVVELGNFDAMYAQGKFFTAEEVLRLAEETVSLVKDRALISVTIPGHLSPEGHTLLARSLELLGVNFIQTEGAARISEQESKEPKIQVLPPAEKLELTVRNTRTLTEGNRVPVMTASGLTSDNVRLAMEAGASAVGIGTYVSELRDEPQMRERVQQVVEAVETAARTLRPVSAV